MLLPLYDPMEAAEIAATLDVLSGGRVSLGLGMGYRPYEFDGFGTAKRTRGARLREAMEVIRLATSQERFSYEGKHYQYEDERCTPVRSSDPSTSGSAAAPRCRARAGPAAGLGYWLANSPFEHTEDIVKEYRQAGKEAGFDESQLRLASFKDVCIGNTMAEAEGLRQMLIDGFYDEHILGYGYLVDERGKNLYNPPKDHPLYQRFIAEPLLRDHRDGGGGAQALRGARDGDGLPALRRMS